MLRDWLSIQEGKDVCPPPFSFCEFTKRTRNGGPTAKALFKSARLIFAHEQISAMGRHALLDADRFRPVCEEFFACEFDEERSRA